MFKKCIGIFMAIIIVCCATTSGYNVNAEEDVFKNFTTNLTGLKVVNGTWTAAEKGILGSNKAEGNTYVMSDVLIKEGISFTYSGDISFSGAAAGIVFGVTDPANPSVKWYCMNAAPVEGGNGALCRLFLVEDSALVIDCNIQLENIDVTKVHTYKIDVLADEDSIEFYMDNEYVGVLSGTGYAGGYLGIVAPASDATFNNVKYAVVEETPVPSPTKIAVASAATNATSAATNVTSAAKTTSVVTKTPDKTNVIQTSATTTGNKNGGNSTAVWSVIIIGLAGVIVAAGVIVLIKKKKKQL